MIAQADATIYLASKRGCVNRVNYRSHRIFNFGEYSCKYGEAFNNLIAFNDDILAAHANTHYCAEIDACIILVPIVGTLRLTTNYGATECEVGSVYHFMLRRGDSFSIDNDGTDIINYLNIWKKVEDHTSDNFNEIKEFNFELMQNIINSFEFKSIKDLLCARMFIGKFGGRFEYEVKLKSKEQGAFVFILEGAFEINNRLLHARDGLAIWNDEKIEFEALSNDSIVLIFE